LLAKGFDRFNLACKGGMDGRVTSGDDTDRLAVGEMYEVDEHF
jgi:hypothetical protein